MSELYMLIFFLSNFSFRDIMLNLFFVVLIVLGLFYVCLPPHTPFFLNVDFIELIF